MAELRVVVGNVEFVDDLGYDESGFVISPDGFEGLDSGVDMRREDLDLPAAHGSYRMPGFLDSRAISISGVAVAASSDALGAMGRQLTALLATGGSALLKLKHHELNVWAEVSLASRTQFVIRAATPWLADFQIQFVAADPRLYGEINRFGPIPVGSILTLSHRGTFPASPRFTINGASAGGYTIGGPDGKNFVVTQPLVGGIPHVVDFRNRRLYVGGNRVLGGIGNATTWQVNPGLPTTIVTITGGTATIAASLPNTYI